MLFFVKVVTGDRVALQCGARPSPALTLQEIVWFRDGERLPVARLQYYNTTKSRCLTVFLHLRQGGEGNYRLGEEGELEVLSADPTATGKGGVGEPNVPKILALPERDLSTMQGASKVIIYPKSDNLPPKMCPYSPEEII